MNEFFSRKWSFTEYVKFVSPSVFSILSISLYTVVDAIFIARYAGPMAMAAVNIVLPFYSFTFGLGIMIASGASAIVGIELGAGRRDRANAHFSLSVAVLAVFMGLIVLCTLLAGADRVALAFGATPALLPYCVDYIHTVLAGIAVVVLQVAGEYFMRLDGQPMWAFYATLLAGVVNVLFDYILIARLDMGIGGAGIATSMGVFAATGVGGWYFLRKARLLRFVRPSPDWRFLRDSVVNGSSEMVSEISTGVKVLVFNFVLLRYAGELGVAAMGILMYVYFLLSGVHFGLSMGISPVVSYNFGSRNFVKIRELVRTTLFVVAVFSLAVFWGCLTHGEILIRMFVRDAEVVRLAAGGLSIFAFGYLVEGIGILSSGFFTAVNNGRISAMISFFKSFVFTLGLVMLLPPYLGVNGVWLSVPLSELGAVCLCIFFFYRHRGRYFPPARSERCPA